MVQSLLSAHCDHGRFVGLQFSEENGTKLAIVGGGLTETLFGMGNQVLKFGFNWFLFWAQWAK